MKKDLKYWLAAADDGGFAIPCFNFNDCWDLKAIVRAAEKERAPVMLSTVAYMIDYLGIEYCAALGHLAMKSTDAAVFLHMDHQHNPEVCKRGVDLGYASVMIDASDKSLEENIAVVKEIVDYAHPHGTLVEAELGRIRGKDDEGVYLGDDFLVQTADTVELTRRTGVDMLAIGIGTQHGFYKGEPNISIERLQEVNSSIPTNLVLHGGTGIPEETIHAVIANGINKINIGTCVRYTYMKTMEESIRELGPGTPPGRCVQPALDAIEEVVRTWIRTCKANNRVK